MSLQTRLSSLITAVGADIKADRARLTTLEALSNGPRCMLYKTAAQTIATSTFVPIVWEGEDEDTLGMHATNGTTVTVPEAGIYFASAFIGWSVGNVAGRFLTMIYVNGVESRAGFRHEITMPAIGTAAWHTGLPTGLFKLAAGDTLSVVVYQNTGGTLSVSANSDNAKFGVFKVDVKGATGATGPVGNPPIVTRARRTTTQSLTAGGAWDKVTFPTEDVDSDNFFNGTKFQPTRAGWYRISAAVQIDNIATTTYDLIQLHLVKNQTGGTYPSGTFTEEARDRRSVVVAAESVAQLEVNQLVYFNGSTDYVEVFVSVVVGRIQFAGGTWFAAEAVGAAGPTGLTGPTGPTGPAGADASALIPARIDWQAIPHAGSVWVESATWPLAVPAWMLSVDGIVHLRGLIEARTGATGLSYASASGMLEPYTAPGANRVYIPGVNQTQNAVGFWEVLSSGLVWHGAVASGDVLGLDGIAYPSIINGPLGVVVTPTLGSGWTSDPTDPLRVWSTGQEIRWQGTIQGTAPAAATTIFTVAGLSSHARVAHGYAIVTTVSGPQHPDTSGVDATRFAVSSSGVVTFDSDYLGTNVIKIKMLGGYSTA